jgi:hypothetical protein
MSYRRPDQNAIDLIRSLTERVEQIERGTGTVRQNTIRMGQWVLEAVDDALVKMTNLTTGVESYIGAPSEGGLRVAVGELPPFVFGGVVRNAFTLNNMATGKYVVDGGGTIARVDVTLGDLDTAGVNSGPRFIIKTERQGTVFASPRITTNLWSTASNLVFLDRDVVWAEILDHGRGDSVNLTVMLRFERNE